MGSLVSVDLWNVTRTAEFLGVGEDWLYDAAKAGKFPHVRIGRNIRFIPLQVEKWIAEHMVKPSPDCR